MSFCKFKTEINVSAWAELKLDRRAAAFEGLTRIDAFFSSHTFSIICDLFTRAIRIRNTLNEIKQKTNKNNSNKIK